MFSRNPNHISPEFPDGYWPVDDAPPAPESCDQSIENFRDDLQAMIDLVANPNTDLYAPIPHGDDPTILREALLVADHNRLYWVVAHVCSAASADDDCDEMLER